MRGAIQLYTFDDVEDPLPAVIDRVGDTSFAGVEFARRADDAVPDEMGDRLAANDLEAVSAHVPIEELEDDLDGAISRAAAIGYDDVVVPWLDPEHFQSVDAVEDAADRLAALAQRLGEADLRLHYHNHDQEFTETEDGPAIHVLAERAPEVSLQVDAGWVLAAGEDPVDFLRLYADRISLVHLKDVDVGSEDAPALGDGDLDLAGVVDAAREIDADWLIFESDRPANPYAELDRADELFATLF